MNSATLSASYRTEIDAALVEHLFGETNLLQYLPLNHAAIPYYVSLRHKYRHATILPLRWHEDQMHRYYWPQAEAVARQLLIVRSGEGSGKSTFIRYYFQVYLPHYAELHDSPIAVGPHELWAELLKRHIVLFCDVRRITYIPELEETIYKALRDQLKALFPDIDSRESYAMWDRIVGGWDAPIHVDAQRAAKVTVAEYRAQYLVSGGYYKSDQEWVRAALYFLGAKRDSGGDRLWRISLVLDNIDQLTEALLIVLIRQLLRSFMRSEPASIREPGDPDFDQQDIFWRVILPMRPEVFVSLEHELAPIGTNFERLDLGDLAVDELIRTRGNLIENTVRASQRHYSENMTIEGVLKGGFHLKTPTVAGRCLRQWFVADIEDDSVSESPDAFFVEDTERSARETLTELANGSARRLLYLRRRLTMNLSVQRQIEKSKIGERPGRTLSAYYFYQGLLTGDLGVYDAGDGGNLIINLYAAGDMPGTPYSTLVAIDSLYLLKNGMPSWGQVVETLKKIGYSDAELEACKRAFIGKGLLKNFSQVGTGIQEFRAEGRIAYAHWNLFAHRAYTDNMAIAMLDSVGGVYPITITAPDEYGDLPARIESAVSFLRFLKSCEMQVNRAGFGAHCHQLSDADFAEFYNALRLQSPFRIASAAYVANVRNLLRKQRKKALGIYLDHHRSKSDRIQRSLGEIDAMLIPKSASPTRKAIVS